MSELQQQPLVWRGYVLKEERWLPQGVAVHLWFAEVMALRDPDHFNASVAFSLVGLGRYHVLMNAGLSGPGVVGECIHTCRATVEAADPFDALDLVLGSIQDVHDDGGPPVLLPEPLRKPVVAVPHERGRLLAESVEHTMTWLV